MLRGFIKRTEKKVERSLDVQSLLELRGTVKTMLQVLFSKQQIAMIRNQRRNTVMDLKTKDKSESNSSDSSDAKDLLKQIYGVSGQVDDSSTNMPLYYRSNLLEEGMFIRDPFVQEERRLRAKKAF